MAPSSSPSPEDSGSSDYIQSSASPSSSSSGSSSSDAASEERRQAITTTTTTTAPPTNDLTDSDSDSQNETEDKEKEGKKWTPYTTAKTSVYTASSSLLTISSRPVTQTHSKPASADEILFHNPPDPNFTLPDSVKRILEDEELLKELPDSDLLKAVHFYVSEFYDSKRSGSGKGGWGTVMGRAMDESALLAVGVILEEYCREMLGGDGDLVLAEREDD